MPELRLPRLLIGCDPGGTSGIFGIWITPEITIAWPKISPLRFIVAQVNGPNTLTVLRAFIDAAGDEPVVIAQERYVVSGETARMGSGGANQTTRDINGAIAALPQTYRNVRVVEAPAGTVKPWASAERLTKLGVTGATRGQRHARDAGGQMAYAAVVTCGLPDPLTRMGAARRRTLCSSAGAA